MSEIYLHKTQPEWFRASAQRNPLKISHKSSISFSQNNYLLLLQQFWQAKFKNSLLLVAQEIKSISQITPVPAIT